MSVACISIRQGAHPLLELTERSVRTTPAECVLYGLPAVCTGLLATGCRRLEVHPHTPSLEHSLPHGCSGRNR